MGLFSSLLRVTVMVPLPAWPSAGFNVESFPQLGAAPSGLVRFLSLYPGLTPRLLHAAPPELAVWPCCLPVGYLSDGWDSRPYLGDYSFVSIRGSRLLGWVPPLRGLCGFLSLYPGLTPRAITCRSSGACRLGQAAMLPELYYMPDDRIFPLGLAKLFVGWLSFGRLGQPSLPWL